MRALLPAALAGLAIAASSTPAQAAPGSLNWSGPVAFDPGGTPSAVSCASESLCVAVDAQGAALSTLDPSAAAPAWSTTALPGAAPLSAVSCAPSGLCAAVDAHGDVFVTAEPVSAAWSHRSIDAGKALTGISCPSASLCVAVDEAGNVWTSATPRSGGWEAAAVDAGHSLQAVSCAPQLPPSQPLCLAVDDLGEVLSSSDPASGAWQHETIDFAALSAVSCATAGACMAVDGAGDALASTDPGTAGATWSLTPIDGEPLTALSCASSGLCAAVDGGGRAFASDDLGAAVPEWSGLAVDAKPLTGVSCVSSGFCLAIDSSGHTLSARVHAPEAITLGTSEVTSSTAVLTAAVDPHGAEPVACVFEYGTALPYTQSSPCAQLPAASGGRQVVSAQLTGLAPNTTYHYRIIATSPAGAGVGGEETFATAISSLLALVTPHPSITGTPAVGQRLTCQPGTPSGSEGELSYAWLRDQIPIPSASASTYTVKGQDSGHHLQCQVTATDGGGSKTAKSSFVTIPAGGAPASAGETAVGGASFKNGKLSVPVTCSAQARGGCQVALRLTVVETLSGARVVAVSARAGHSARSSAASLRHTTVTLASARAHLSAGARATLSTVLGASAKRLLAARRHFSANLLVTGTVIGVIEARLAQQLVTLNASSGHAPGHGARRR
ncbi:MAG TPA: fibronectin type III domain-containing protein [Solirubrobacteraceae bacterium]|nr:fibronectin type III domain-containing protein [Solirubrobacteraceae bacterium]